MPLRFPRSAMVTAVIGLAAAMTMLGSVPALADQVRQDEWWLAAMHITQAQQTAKGSGVTIALLDTGVDSGQPDLGGSVITGPDYTNSGESLGDQASGIHGTAMASLIVGHGHGPGATEGVVGVAPDARLLSARVALDSGDPLLTDSAITSGLPGAIAEGIRYAVNSGAQVIDLPLDPGQSESDLVASSVAPAAPSPGASPSPAAIAQQAAAGGSFAERSAVAYALGKGVVLVAPAGDNRAGTNAANFPADYPGVISVGALDSSFSVAPFSIQQPYVTLTAAGSSMTAAVPGGYDTVGSTAAASAIVTGIAALIKSRFPELTPAQISEALTNGTRFRPAAGTQGAGRGTADAQRALAAAAAIAAPGPDRAGAGAAPRSLPAAPRVPAADRSLAPTLERDAIVSAAVLIALLLPITGYALARRRRGRLRTPTAHAEHASAARSSAYGLSGSSPAHDRMLEYFAAPPAQAREDRGRPAPGSGRGPGSGAHAVTARRDVSRPGRFADSGSPSGGDAPRPAARLPLAPATRASAVRPAKVSGSPPWGPAPKPDTALPWATSPPPTLTRRAPATNLPPPAAGSIWNAPTEGGEERASEPVAGAWGEAADSSERAGRPIYVWNPSANTDAFPKASREDDQAD